MRAVPVVVLGCLLWALPAGAADPVKKPVPQLQVKDPTEQLLDRRRQPAPKPSLERKCGPGDWPLGHFTGSPTAGDVYPGDTVVLEWRLSGPGNTAWRDRVTLSDESGRVQAVSSVGNHRVPAARLGSRPVEFVLKTTCMRKVVRMQAAQKPQISSVSPSRYVCEGSGDRECPGSMEIIGRHFGPPQWSSSDVAVWRDPSSKFGLRVLSWSDTRIRVDMPSKMRNGDWYFGVRAGPTRTRNLSSDPFRFEVAYEMEHTGVVAQRRILRPAPRGGGGGSGGDDDADCEEGTPCTVHPTECSGRPDAWTVPGVTRCRGSEAVCEARRNEDYCTICGGACGGCPGNACSASAPCGATQICRLEHGPTGSVYRCAAIRDTSTPGRVACTRIPGFCWTPAELREENADGLGCLEHEEEG